MGAAAARDPAALRARGGNLRRTAPLGRNEAALAALAFILLPANVWSVFITTDTPLIFFCFASAFAFWLGIVRRLAGWHALAGVFLGLAFLSKYSRSCWDWPT